MTPAADTHRSHRRRARGFALALLLATVAFGASATEPTTPAFSKEFMPDTIGPGSTAMLIFTIDNSDNPFYPVTDLAFTDVLPDEIDLAAPAFVFNSCGGTVTAPDGGTTITLADGLLSAGLACEIVVNVTSSEVGEGPWTNTSGDLTSSAGNSGPAEADLQVDANLPGFSKSFSPATVPFGGRSTLTFEFDNSLSGTDYYFLSFIDNLPTGMAVAGPANVVNTCSATFDGVTFTGGVVVAVPGTSVISLEGGAFNVAAVGGEGSCTISVDVIGGAVGSLGNVSESASAIVWPSGSTVSSGKAAAVLEVTGFETPLGLTKRFVDDPVAPGGTVTLDFTVLNRDRADSATGITFDDDLEATLGGLAPTLPLTPVPDPPCGTGSTLSFSMGVLTLAGGTLLPPEDSCTFSVELTVPLGSAAGAYPNTTTAVSGDVGGSPVIGNTASDLLFVDLEPIFTKEYIDDPTTGGGTVTLRFTITNTDPGSALTGIEFTDNIGGIDSELPGLAANSLVAPSGLEPAPLVDPCGAGSLLTIPDPNDTLPSPPFPPLPPDPTQLVFTGGSLAAAGMPGDSCSFDVVLDVPAATPSGVYLNTTSDLTATPSGAPPASDGLIVAAAPLLTKEFTDDPALPGGTVTLELTLSHPAEATGDATAISFTDDLAAVLPGTPDLTAALDTNTCGGATVDVSTPTFIDVSGGTLSPGESCTISLTVTVPPAAPVGSYTNTTSDVSAQVDGLMTTGSGDADVLLISPLAFTKEFIGDPVIPGDTLTLAFTISNLGAVDATDVGFSDDLAAVLPGTPDLIATLPPATDTCGGTMSGPTSLSYTGGSVTAGATCTIELDVLVPLGTADGDYLNVTSSLAATFVESGVTLPPASDVLTVDSNLLALSKEFTDDPVLPEDPVTLVFTLENLSPTETITDISFSDDLNAALSGLEATGATANTCGGMATSAFPTGLFEYADGELGPGATCMIELTVVVPPGPLPGTSFLNTTSGVTGRTDICPDGTMPSPAGALAASPPCVFGDPASDTLEVRLLSLEKSFDGPTVPTGTAVLTFTITNLDSVNDKTGLAFSDDLDAVLSGLEAVLPPSPDPPCGVGSVAAGTSFLAVTNASVAAGGSCSFDVTVSVPDGAPAGDFLNTTSELFQSGIPAAAAATAFLTVEPPPAFSKEFVPDTIEVDGVSTLTFTIDNTASALDATSLAFADTLPAGVVVATPSNATTDCAGGTVTAVSGTGTISFSGGTVAAGASCTVSVDVTTDTAGMYVNVSDDLTSSSGTSGSATDTLTVEVAEADLELLKTDLFEPVMSGRYQLYLLTVTNLGPGDAEEVVLTDVLPAGVVPVLVEPLSDCAEAGGVVTCDIGDLADGESFTAQVLAYVELSEMPAPLDNLATVTSETDDPDTANNDVLESTEVIPLAGVAALADGDGNGSFEVAVPVEGSIDVLVKDTLAPFATLHQTEVFPDGWALAGFDKKPGVNGARDDVVVLAVEIATGAAVAQVVAGADGTLGAAMVVPPPFLPLAMTVIADEASGSSLVVVVARRLDNGTNQTFVFDAISGALTGTVPVHPSLWPLDVTSVESFGGDDMLPELAFLTVKTTTGTAKVQVKELTGTLIPVQKLPAGVVWTAVASLPNCCSSPAPEVAVLGWDAATGAVRVRTVDADGGGLVSDKTFAANAAPAAVATVTDFADTTADEIVALYRNGAGRAAARMRDTASGALLFVGGFGPASGAIPLGLAIFEDDMVVYWEDATGGTRKVTVRDGMTGAVVANVPIP